MKSSILFSNSACLVIRRKLTFFVLSSEYVSNYCCVTLLLSTAWMTIFLPELVRSKSRKEKNRWLPQMDELHQESKTEQCIQTGEWLFRAWFFLFLFLAWMVVILCYPLVLTVHVIYIIIRRNQKNPIVRLLIALFYVPEHSTRFWNCKWNWQEK